MAGQGQARFGLGSPAAGVPPYRDTASYHCQQAAEKGLKGSLTAKSQPFPKTHDLTVLLKLAEPYAAEFAGLASAAVVLTPYATLFRYPDSVLEPDDDDVREALILAEDVMQTVSAVPAG